MSPAVINDGYGRGILGERGGDNVIYLRLQAEKNGSWANWLGIPSNFRTGVVFSELTRGSVGIFTLGTGGVVFWNKYAPISGSLSGWSVFAGVSQQFQDLPAVSVNMYGLRHMVGVGTGSELLSADEYSVSWTSLGSGFRGVPTLAKEKDGRLHVFGVGADNVLRHCWQQIVNGQLRWSAVEVVQ